MNNLYPTKTLSLKAASNVLNTLFLQINSSLRYVPNIWSDISSLKMLFIVLCGGESFSSGPFVGFKILTTCDIQQIFWWDIDDSQILFKCENIIQGLSGSPEFLWRVQIISRRISQCKSITEYFQILLGVILPAWEEYFPIWIYAFKKYINIVQANLLRALCMFYDNISVNMLFAVEKPQLLDCGCQM